MIIGLDPSFKGFGVCLLDTHNKIITTVKLSEEIEKLSFDEICYSVDKLIDKLMLQIGGRKLDLVITETPPPTARFSAGLYALDYAVTRKLLKEKQCRVLGVSPSYIGHLHKKRKWNKSESVKLAKEIVNKVLVPSGYDIKVNFESNQCEALLIAMRGAYEQGLFRSMLSDIKPEYSDELEFNLY